MLGHLDLIIQITYGINYCNLVAVIGNIGRYLNHSCDPNLAMVTIRSNSMVPHLALFTSRTVQKVWNSDFHN